MRTMPGTSLLLILSFAPIVEAQTSALSERERAYVRAGAHDDARAGEPDRARRVRLVA